MPLRFALAVLAITLFLVGPSAAHTEVGVADGFAAGFKHPFSGPDHLLAMVSVGLWGAFLGRPLIVILPILFPSVMALGGVLGIERVPIPPVELGVALSVVSLGAAIGLSWRPAAWVACVLTATFAIFHGYAHGAELPHATNPFGYSAGFVLATGLLHVIGITLGFMLEHRHGALIARGIGMAIAVAGSYYLGRAVL